MRMRVSSLLLVLAFVSGVIVYPAWHQAHCGVQSRPDTEHVPVLVTVPHANAVPGHDPGHCQVCTLATVAFDQPYTAISPTPGVPQYEPANPPSQTPVRRLAFILPFSRGPPSVI